MRRSCLRPKDMDETAKALVGEVDRLRRYVQGRMWGFPSEVDNVLQEARVTVWRCTPRFDPARGGADAFVFGIVSRVTSKEIGRLMRAPLTAPLEAAEMMATTEGADVLDNLLINFELETQESRVAQWISVVADATSEVEWAAVVALSRFDGDTAAAAASLGTSVGTLRSARGRARALVQTTRAAMALLEVGETPTAERCVPVEGGLRDVLAHVDAPCPSDAAAALGIAEGVYRTRRALVRRAVALVEKLARATTPTS